MFLYRGSVRNIIKPRQSVRMENISVFLNEIKYKTIIIIKDKPNKKAKNYSELKKD